MDSVIINNDCKSPTYNHILEKVKNYCRRIEGETINKSKMNFMFVLRDVLSSLGECQYFSYV